MGISREPAKRADQGRCAKTFASLMIAFRFVIKPSVTDLASRCYTKGAKDA